MKKVKLVAVIGMGSIAARHRQNITKLFPEAKVAAMSSSGRTCNSSDITYCDRVYNCLDNLCADSPDFAIVASPSSMRLGYVSSLIECGIPLLIEKPLASTLNEAQELEKVCFANEGKSSAAVAYCLRHLDSAAFLKSKIESSAFGEVYSAFIEVGQYLPDWRPSQDYRHSVSANAHLGGGALNELSHEIDYAQWLFGPLQLMCASVRNTGTLNIDVEDIADLALQTEGGVHVSIHLDFLQRVPIRKCVIVTEEGRVEWDLLTDQITLTTASGIESLYSPTETDRNKMYMTMLDRFYQQIITGKKDCSLCSPLQAMRVAELIDQAKLWARK